MTMAQRASADRLLGSKGQAITITRRAAGSYDTATGLAALVKTSQTGKGVILDFAAGVRNREGSTVLANDRQLYLSAVASDGTALTPPQVDDFVTAGGHDFVVTEVSSLAPAGLTIMYTCIVRGVA